MTPDLRDTLIKAGLPILAVVIALIVAKLRGFNVREFAGLRRPNMRWFWIFIAVWIAWMAFAEVFLVEPAGAWRAYAPLVIALRVLAIGILGPIAEELIFRGVIYGRLAPHLGAHVTIILIAVVFGLVHTRYAWATIAIVAVDGVFFGYARYKSDSVYTPMVMHAMGNLFSVWQSLNA